MDDFRQRLDTAFSNMRNMGLVARRNHLCCNSCAGADLATRVSKMSKSERDAVYGCCFYHGQDNEGIDEDGGVFLSYGPLHVAGIGQVGKSALEVGRVVASACWSAGLFVEWDEKASSRIWVRLP